MSYKRFKKGINLSCVDTKTGTSYWYACNLCGLLNELADENEQLKSERRNDTKEFSALFKPNLRLKRENDNLKCKLEDTEKAFDKVHKSYIELCKQQGKLEIENEQLKQELRGRNELLRLYRSERKKLEKEIEESKITIQLYEADVSMRDNFLKSKGLYDEFLQCNMDGG